VRLLSQPVWKRLVAELAAFGVIGAVCLASDILLFNLLAFGLGLHLLVAKSIGMVITGTMAYVGHRHVTFRHRTGGGHSRDIPVFVLVTLATVALSLFPIYLARELAGSTSVFWLNIANLTGIALGTVTRYVAYRTLVWSDTGGEPAAPSGGGTDLVDVTLPSDQAGHLRVFEVDYELVRE
jgi:putative flippase GtrA